MSRVVIVGSWVAFVGWGCLDPRAGRVVDLEDDPVDGSCGGAYGCWRFPGEGSPVAVAAAPDGDAFIGSRDSLVRVDAETGCTLWLRAASSAVRDVAALGDDLVILHVGVAPSVERVAGATGDPIWEQPLTGDAAAIAGGGGRGAPAIVVVAEGGEVLALDGDGGELWRRALAGAGHPSSEEDALADVAVGSDGAVSVAGRVVGDLVVWRLAGGDGAVVWRRALGVRARALPRLAAESGGDVFVSGLWWTDGGGDRQGVSRLAAADGSAVWAYDAPAELVRHMGGSAPALAVAGMDLVMAGVVVERTGFGDDLTIEPVETFGLEGFIVRLAGHMAVVWTVEPVGGAGVQLIHDAVGDPSGAHWVVGWFEREVRVAGVALEDEAGGGFVARRPVGIGW